MLLFVFVSYIRCYSCWCEVVHIGVVVFIDDAGTGVVVVAVVSVVGADFVVAYFVIIIVDGVVFDGVV